MKIEKCVCVSFICFILMNFLFSFRPPTECTLNALDFCCFEEKIRGNSNHIPNAFYSQKFPTFPDFQIHSIPSFPKPSGNPKIFGFPSVLKAQWTLKGKFPLPKILEEFPMHSSAEISFETQKPLIILVFNPQFPSIANH